MTRRPLERVADPDDHRSKRVHLTERGHAAMRTIRAAVTTVEQEWAHALGTEELEQLRTLLTRLAAVVAPAPTHINAGEVPHTAPA